MTDIRCRLVVVLLLLIAGVAWGKDQEPDPMPVNDEGAYEYSDTVEVEGATADELYSRAKAWVANAYRSAQNVVQLDDKDAHRLIIKGNSRETYLMMGQVTVRHVVTIETKDGRYRYRMTGFVVDYDGGNSTPLEGEIKPGKKKLLRRVHNTATEMLSELWAAMEVEADDDW